LRTHDAGIVIMHEVRERAAFTCDVGSTPDRLAERFPHHNFDHLPRQWWHRGLEPVESTVARADEFRKGVAAREDSATTLLVSHWAFILALSGRSLENGEILQYDPGAGHPGAGPPAARAPLEIDWDS
jgi:broad specificity phosphatase PhoE